MEFFNQTRSYILLFIVFGLWTSFQQFKYKRLLRIYSICSLLSVLLLFAVSMYNTQFHTFTSIPNTVANILLVLVWIIHLMVAVESILKSNVQKQLIDKFEHVDELFKIKLNTRIAYQTEKCDLFKKNLTLSSLIMPIYIGVTIYLVSRNGSFDPMYLTTYSFFVIRLRITQIILFVFLLRNRLNLINDKLKHISKVVRTPNTMATRSQRLIAIYSCSSLNFSNYETLTSLKEIYQELYDICDLINSAFGCSLFGILTQNFVDLTSNCYWGYLLRNDRKSFFVFVGFIIPNLSVLAFFCFYCSSCYLEVRSKFRSKCEIIC